MGVIEDIILIVSNPRWRRFLKETGRYFFLINE
jgi:hypothetical protein